MKSVNIVILGLSLRVLNDLKQIVIQILPADIQVNWLNITAPELDILMINDAFYNAPSIQHLIHSKNLKILKLVNNTDKNSTIDGNILYLPVQQPIVLGDWLKAIVLEPVSSSNVLLDLNPTQASTGKQQQSQSMDEILIEIQNPRNGKMQIFDSKGVLALVDPQGEWVWHNAARVGLVSDHTLNYTYATMNDSSTFSDTTPEDMKVWLWNLLWQSPVCVSQSVTPSSFILTYWPQPKRNTDRRDILRMSACFGQGAKIHQVAQHLEISETRVRQFVAVSLAVGFGEVISDAQSKYQSNRQVSNADTGLIRRLFGGLRRRLGF